MLGMHEVVKHVKLLYKPVLLNIIEQKTYNLIFNHNDFLFYGRKTDFS